MGILSRINCDFVCLSKLNWFQQLQILLFFAKILLHVAIPWGYPEYRDLFHFYQPEYYFYVRTLFGYNLKALYYNLEAMYNGML